MPFGGRPPHHCEEAKRRSNPFCLFALWIASRNPSSAAHSRDPLARNDVGVGCLKIESPSYLSPAQKRQALEQMHVLFVLQQRAVQRRGALFRGALPVPFRLHVPAVFKRPPSPQNPRLKYL